MANEIQADHPSGSVLYAIIRNRQGQTWYPPGEMFEDWGAGGHTAADYDIILTDKGGSRHIGDFDPAIPSGVYCIQIFEQAGGVPAETDTLVSSRDFVWTGVGELNPTKMLANRAVHSSATGLVDYYDDDGQTILITLAMDPMGSGLNRTPV